MHGGIGRSIHSVEQIEKLERPITMDAGSIILMDLLWYALIQFICRFVLFFVFCFYHECLFVLITSTYTGLILQKMIVWRVWDQMLEGLVLSLLGYACYCHCKSVELNLENLSSFIVLVFLYVWMYSSTSISKFAIHMLNPPNPSPFSCCWGHSLEALYIVYTWYFILYLTCGLLQGSWKGTANSVGDQGGYV